MPLANPTFLRNQLATVVISAVIVQPLMPMAIRTKALKNMPRDMLRLRRINPKAVKTAPPNIILFGLGDGEWPGAVLGLVKPESVHLAVIRRIQNFFLAIPIILHVTCCLGSLHITKLVTVRKPFVRRIEYYSGLIDTTFDPSSDTNGTECRGTKQFVEENRLNFEDND